MSGGGGDEVNNNKQAVLEFIYSRITQLKKTAKAFDAAIDGSFDKQVKQLELSL